MRPPLLDAAAVAQQLGTSVRHIRRLVQERRIPHVKVGRYVRFDPNDITTWIEENYRWPVNRKKSTGEGRNRSEVHDD